MKAQRFLRNKSTKKWFPWIIPLLKPLFRREYWLPSPHRMALGLSIGLFFAFSMMVIPVQMILAAFVCLFLRANLPLSLGACWISNPVTIPFLIVPMVWMGKLFERLTGSVFDANSIKILGQEVNYAHFLSGCIFSGVILALLAYPCFLLVWYLSPLKNIKSPKKKKH